MENENKEMQLDTEQLDDVNGGMLHPNVDKGIAPKPDRRRKGIWDATPNVDREAAPATRSEMERWAKLPQK